MPFATKRAAAVPAVTLGRYASAEEALPHIQAIVLQEQEAASARASRGEVDAAADGEADATLSASEDKAAVNVCCAPDTSCKSSSAL
jgi:hypothetical protein